MVTVDGSLSVPSTNPAFTISDFLVDMQNLDHLLFEVRIPALHVIADLVWSDLTLRQYPVKFRPAHFVQTGMARRQAVLPHVTLQQSVSPQFVGVAQILRLLAGTVQHPGNRVIRDAAALARSWQLSQRRIDSELQELTNTQRDRVPIHAVGDSDRAIAHAVGALQENGRVKHLPFLRAAGSTEIFQSFPDCGR